MVRVCAAHITQSNYVLGLIRWKIVIHAFIDGFSRYLLGIRASNNNRGETVLDLFEGICFIYGYPSRVRGDHGIENLLVATRMEEVRGIERGSYIWGRCALIFTAQYHFLTYGLGVFITFTLSASGLMLPVALARNGSSFFNNSKFTMV